jgi:squalene-associated FAD-dependent desaturase
MHVMIAGGGLAGLAAAAALGSAGFQVDLHEARPFLGGRASSFPLSPADPDSERIDNCQHVLLRCCTNLIDFYRRCGVLDKIRFFDEYYFVEPGGRVSCLKAGRLAPPFHFLGSFLGFGALGWRDKLAVARGLRAMAGQAQRPDLDSMTFGCWLDSQKQTSSAIERFWAPVVTSALNEEPGRVSAQPAFQVFQEGFLRSAVGYQMGVPAVPLAELYAAAMGKSLGANVRIHLRSPVSRIDPAGKSADYYLIAVPFERVKDVAPDLDLRLEKFEHSPITGIHLWLDREITDLPQAALLGRTMQWIFRKSPRYYQCVVSASRALLFKPRQEIIELARTELCEFFPAARQARVERAHVIKEARATYSAAPGVEAARPGPETKFPNLFLAGDWTCSGWPATMEGAVRSGYRAAEAIARAAGRPARFLL